MGPTYISHPELSSSLHACMHHLTHSILFYSFTHPFFTAFAGALARLETFVWNLGPFGTDGGGNGRR